MMTTLLAMSTVAWLATTDGVVKPPKPMSQLVGMSISTDRTQYYVNEPVYLTISFRNTSSDQVIGWFYNACSHGMAECKLKSFYRRADGLFTRFGTEREQPTPGMPDAWLLPSRLKPGDEKIGVSMLLFNHVTNGFVLGEPGTYEFKVIHWDDDPYMKLESNVVNVEVQATPTEERSAVELYRSSKMGRFVQEDLWTDDEAVRLAISFLEKHPNSRYAGHVTRPLLGVLGQKVRMGKATHEQRQLFERLDEEDRARGREIPTWADATPYKGGDIVSYASETWKCIQGHRSQTDWTPPVAQSLWVKIAQNNVWDSPVEYAAGDEVTYQGATYTCRQAHTSQAGWAPPNTPALWNRK